MKTALLACVSFVLLAAAFAVHHAHDHPACISVKLDEKIDDGPCHGKRLLTDQEAGVKYCCEDLGRRPIQMWVWSEDEGYHYMCHCVTSQEALCLEHPSFQFC
ncbi:hypothetical protein PoB_001614800 [Plakobranchus ocellatus]|uniref:Uncharacterized protein n=1 Tax=Plakobranchus ocellatus TaxID=259542 RepID=A0AAV3Z4J0_9GAST|nr:hypothetical protein PoB_001614800 [Plakobranchus ocellatus]